MPGPDSLATLRHKYDSVVKLMHERGVRVQAIEMQGDKLLLRAEAPSEEAKNAIWTEIKRVDASYGDLAADIRVVPGQGGPAAGAAAAPPATSYTVKKGDTLSKISQQVYGSANEYKRIFEANRDQLSDPDKIQPGQVLRIPAR